MENGKVVVVGGAGFIGSHIADKLSAEGYKVVVLDQMRSDFLQHDQEMVIADILDLDAIRAAFEGAKFVFHFGGVSEIAAAAQDPLKTVNANIIGATNCIHAAAELGIDRFIFASTMYVYSSMGSFYRVTKQAAESLIQAYNEKFGVDFTLIRYGSLYGPRSQAWNGLHKYVQEITSTGCIRYPGNGNERREYVHVEDAADLSVRILADEYRNKAVMITGQQSISSANLLKSIFEINGMEPNIEFLGEDAGGDHYFSTPYRYSPMRATKLVPRQFVDLGQGILDLVERCSPDQLCD